jgi:hypothetical protein
MVLFGVLFAINVVVALVAFGFFVVGLADGSVTTFNILIWAALLGTLFSVPFAGWLLRLRGQRRLATIVLLPMAGVAAVAGVLTLVMIINPPHWN